MDFNFNKRVLRLTVQIPPGRVTSYGELARALGGVKFSRAVGNALRMNSRPVEIPCHRVVRSDGSLGGYSRGVKEKIKLLRNEGIQIRDGKVLDFGRVFFRLDSD